jgi:hypothetical protein
VNSTPDVRRIFISSSSDVDTTALSQLLTDSGYLVRRPNDLPPGDVAAGLRSLIEGSDAVIAVVGEAIPPATLVEIGVAIGGRLPVVILVEGQVDAAALPLMVRSLPTIVLGGADLSSTAFRLLSALEIPPAAESKAPIQSAEPPRQSTTAKAREWADETERAVAEVLQAKGYRVVPQPTANTVGQVDLAVWISDLGDPVLNPVLIEVAGRRPNVAAKVEQLGRYLRASRLALGMLVTTDDAEPRLRVSNADAIVMVGIGWLQTATTADILRVLTDGRNALFHGTK